jgi:hypothetical protein
MGSQRKVRLVRAGTLGILGFLVSAMVSVAVWRAYPRDEERVLFLALENADSPPVAFDGETESRITAFCGDCHAMPAAGSFPRDAWYEKVKKGYEFYARSGRNDLDLPPVHLTIAYFRSRAPEQLVFAEAGEVEPELRDTFSVDRLALDENATSPPELSHLRWTRLEAGADPVLLACDMRNGYVASVDLCGREPYVRVLARLENPCHVEPCDLDGDGSIDLIVADQGGYLPDDHDRGRVVWLRQRAATGSFEEVVVASGMARAVDVRPADVDSDGDLDLIVAEFGWYRTGRIVLLRNVTMAGEEPRFEPEELDPRPGTIHVPVHDFNDDGHPDFVALVSQEYECVEAFINEGAGRFRPQSLWTGPDLTFGSSGIELADLDRDGDLDILYTNGDAWDNSYANPSHGVQWLENLGSLQFAYHRLTDLPGAYRALPGDIDLDGDLDILAVAWLPRQVLPANLAGMTKASIVYLEQESPGVFVRHVLETAAPDYATLELADFDNDGDLDFAVGAGPHVVGGREPSHWLSVWWNRRKEQAEP